MHQTSSSTPVVVACFSHRSLCVHPSFILDPRCVEPADCRTVARRVAGTKRRVTSSRSGGVFGNATGVPRAAFDIRNKNTACNHDMCVKDVCAAELW